MQLIIRKFARKQANKQHLSSTKLVYCSIVLKTSLNLFKHFSLGTEKRINFSCVSSPEHNLLKGLTFGRTFPEIITFGKVVAFKF